MSEASAFGVAVGAAELRALEPELRREVDEAFADQEGWPTGCCDSTCETLLTPESAGGYGWAERFGLRVVQGSFDLSGLPHLGGGTSGHVYLIAEDGTIVDPTAGQFLGPPALRVVGLDHPLRRFYDPERSPVIRVALVGPERILLEEIADPRMRQADVIATYALALETPGEVDWPRVNRAIVERWSPGGLRRVKDAAWRARRRG